MNVLSVPTAVNALHCLTKYVMVYPLGQIPPWLPEDYQPEGQIETSELRFAQEPPLVGAVETFDGRQWIVAAVQIYQPVKASSGPTAGVYVAVCTVDGTIGDRPGWRGTAPLLYVPARVNGELATNLDGSSYYGMSDRVEGIPPAIFSDWEISTVQAFEPVGKQQAQDYAQVLIYWCNLAEADSAT